MTERTQPLSAPTPGSSAATDASTARFQLSAEEFAFADLFEQVPDATIELEPAVANPDNHALLVVETDANQRTVDAALQSSTSVTAVEGFGSHGHRARYRVIWEGSPRRVIQRFTTEGVTLVGVHGKEGRWEFRVVAPERTALAQAHEALEDLGCNPECLSISPFKGGWSGCVSVTEKQRQTLTRAFKMGYYSVPREVTAKELATDLDVSHQALSERFRRAHQELIQDANIIT